MFFASNDSKRVTGETLFVTGGIQLAIGPVFVPSGNFSGALHGREGSNVASCNYVCVFRQAFTGRGRYASCVGSGELARLRTGGGT